MIPQFVIIDKHANTSKALCHAPIFFVRFAIGRLNVLHNCDERTEIIYVAKY